MPPVLVFSHPPGTTGRCRKGRWSTHKRSPPGQVCHCETHAEKDASRIWFYPPHGVSAAPSACRRLCCGASLVGGGPAGGHLSPWDTQENNTWWKAMNPQKKWHEFQTLASEWAGKYSVVQSWPTNPGVLVQPFNDILSTSFDASFDTRMLQMVVVQIVYLQWEIQVL